MSGRLFAFQVAKPVEPVTEEAIAVTYDPATQTSVWQGGTDALAFVHCTDVWFGGQGRRCEVSAPGGEPHCYLFGGSDYHGYRCDR